MKGFTDPLRAVQTRVTPQSEAADPRQTRNAAGGFTFEVTPLQRLRRFLTLGVDGGTYYATAPNLAKDNAQVVLELARTDGHALVTEIVAISQGGRAPRNQPALFALAIAIAHGDVDTRRAAAEALPQVARTGTHLMQFNAYVKQFRGRGRVLDRAIENWYLKQPVGRLAYQVVKYRQREGWTHRDLLRLAKPKAAADDAIRRVLFDWICHRTTKAFAFGTEEELRVVAGFEHAQRATNARGWADCVELYGLPWEALPTQALNSAAVWEAFLKDGLPQTALIRQLPRLTNLGLLPATGGWTNEVVHQLTDAERLRNGRVHPINVLVAQRTYAQGHSERGETRWIPSRRIVDALDTAFYAAFGAVRSTGQRLRLALDVSPSMNTKVSSLPITCMEASAALALVTANVETEYEVVAFASASGSGLGFGGDPRRRGIITLNISPRQRLDDVLRVMRGVSWGGTDCALPMTSALQSRAEFDAFFIYTDNETWAGTIHPHEALTRYRQSMGIPAALGVVGMTATRSRIGDVTDARTLDVVGFDSATPNMLSDFVVGDV
jgi:60 kDa SS-A/Ro ribonucleoprotein